MKKAVSSSSMRLQSAPHIPVDVQALDADFLVFFRSQADGTDGNRRPVRKRDPSDAMPPFLTGGEMIDSVSRESAVFAELPHKFEAGTVNGGAVGLQAAIDYLMNVGFDEVRKRELLTTRAMTAMQQIPGVHIQGSDKPEEHNGIISFTVDGVHPHDIASIPRMPQMSMCAQATIAASRFKTSGCILQQRVPALRSTIRRRTSTVLSRT